MKRPKTLLTMLTVALTALSACGGATPSDGTATVTIVDASQTTTTSATVAASTETETSAVEAALVDNAATHEDVSDYEWDAADVVPVTFEGATVAAGGAGVIVTATTATITTEGTYRLSGSSSDGQVVVNVAGDGVVRLVLDGLDLTSATGAPLVVLDAEKVVVVLADGTVNTLADATTYGAAAADDTPTAPLYSTADLTITGGGALVVEGNSNDGIVSKDGLVIADGIITVAAVDDGIRGKDYLVIEGGAITVTAGGDGLKADNEEDPSLGYITLGGGMIEVVSGGDALEAATDLTVAAGTISVVAGGGAGVNPGTASAKGLKGLVSVTIAGGSVAVDAADDAVHSNGAVAIAGGVLHLATGDDGVHADASLLVSGGTIDITTSYEGLESAVITIEDGDIEIHSSDDGINVAGGADGSGGQQRPGRGNPGDAFAASGDYHLYINGGTVVIYAQGDGLDSNGTVDMTGGTVVVHGPTANNNGAIDAGAFDISGGFLVAVGSAGMAEGVDASSGASIAVRLGSTQQAGTVIHIEAADGTGLLTFEPSKAYQAITFYTPELTAGGTYAVYLGGSATGDAVGGLYAAGAYTAGTLAGNVSAG